LLETKLGCCHHKQAAPRIILTSLLVRTSITATSEGREIKVMRGEDRARWRLISVGWMVPPQPRCDEEGIMEMDEDAPRREINPV
jgi:hypothetical protein